MHCPPSRSTIPSTCSVSCGGPYPLVIGRYRRAHLPSGREGRSVDFSRAPCIIRLLQTASFVCRLAPCSKRLHHSFVVCYTEPNRINYTIAQHNRHPFISRLSSFVTLNPRINYISFTLTLTLTLTTNRQTTQRRRCTVFDILAKPSTV